jgi:hypothetical protein
MTLRRTGAQLCDGVPESARGATRPLRPESIHACSGPSGNNRMSFVHASQFHRIRSAARSIAEPGNEGHPGLTQKAVRANQHGRVGELHGRQVSPDHGQVDQRIHRAATGRGSCPPRCTRSKQALKFVSATPDLRQRTGQSPRQQLCAACSPRPTFRPRSAVPGQVVIQASGVGTAAAVEASAPTLFCQAACAHVHTGLLLADHAPQYARCARRPLPAMALSRSSSPAAKLRHSSRGNKIAQPAILR